MSSCPTCFMALDPEVAVLRCTGTCSGGPDAEATAYRGHPVQGRPVFEVPVQGPEVSAACPRCRSTSISEACRLCHTDLPSGWRSTRTTCIAMAGARYSGKTVYMGVMVRQLRTLWTQHGRVLSPLDARTDDMYRDRYETALFKERHIPVATPPQRRGDAHYEHAVPLLYQLSAPGAPRHVLVIRDVAGEDLQRPSIDEQLFSFFGRADGIVFLVDPLQIRAVRQQLEGTVSWGGSEEDNPLLVLRNLADLQSRVHIGRRTVPLALVLAKFDALEELGRVEDSPLREVMRNRGAAFLRDPSLDGLSFDATSGDVLDAELTSLMSLIHGQELVNYARQAFPHLRLFAASALGHHPSADRLGRTGITPFRCLDPVKWVLDGAPPVRV